MPRNKSDRDAKKAEKEAIEEEWKRLQAVHEREVEALSRNGVPKSCHPKKPPRL
jgi:hypothetical protein